MNKQELDEMYPAITETNKLLEELKEELEKVFPQIEIAGDRLMATLNSRDTTLIGEIETKHYYLAINYEDDTLTVRPIITDYVDPNDVLFWRQIIISLKGLIEEYNMGREIDLFDAEQWINNFTHWRALEKNGLLIVKVKPRTHPEFVDVYSVAKGGFYTSKLTVEFKPLRHRGVKFVVFGELTTKRFKNVLSIFKSFEKY
jgi:hypothetical protein